VLVELSVMEQRYQAVLAVVQDGWRVVLSDFNQAEQRPMVRSPSTWEGSGEWKTSRFPVSRQI
jgi:hypothetical protein